MAQDKLSQAMANAAANAKASVVEQRNSAAANRARVASGKASPAPAPHVEMPDTNVADKTVAAILARLEALEAKNAALETENAALKSNKAAPKADRGPVTMCEGCEWKMDTKTGKLTITVDLQHDIIDAETGLPRLSTSGKTTGVAQFNAKFPDKDGREVGISLNAYHKIGK